MYKIIILTLSTLPLCAMEFSNYRGVKQTTVDPRQQTPVDPQMIKSYTQLPGLPKAPTPKEKIIDELKTPDTQKTNK
jgi:hypothetical protein